MRIREVEHDCPRGGIALDPRNQERPLTRQSPDQVTCGSCERSWCEACQPAPAAMCVWCHGTGVDEAARMSIDLDDPHDVLAFLTNR